MIPRLPYLQNAVSGFQKLNEIETIKIGYVNWMREQGVIMPIVAAGSYTDIDSIRLEFTSPELETMFILRWA